MRAVVVINRRARQLQKPGPLLDALRSGTALPFESHDPVHLDELMQRVRDTAPDAVILAGGDGSYMAGASALVRAYGDRSLPAIGLAPGGTACTIARNFGLHGDRVQDARRLVSPAGLVAAPRPSLRIGDRVGFIFGAGLVARFFEVYEPSKGLLGAAMVIARVFAGSFTHGALAARILSSSACEVEVDDVRARFDRVSLVCASVVRDLGLGLELMHRAAEESGRFHVVATPMEPSSLGPQLLRVLRGKPLVGERIDRLARRLELRFARGEGAWVLDGELIRGDHVVVEAGPVLRVLGYA